MISKTELRAYGFSNEAEHNGIKVLTNEWFSESGDVSIDMEKPDVSYSICVYTDVVDTDGDIASQGVLEIEKSSALTINEFIAFVKFIEDETF